MNRSELKYAIYYLQQEDGLVLPYGVMPGDFPDGTYVDFGSESAWEKYQWNPPQHYKHLRKYVNSDNSAGAKPLWARLNDATVPGAKLFLIEDFRVWTRDQISRRIFDAHDVLDEALDAAAARHTTTQRAHRDQVIIVYRAAREAIRNAADILSIETSHADGMSAITALLDTLDPAA